MADTQNILPDEEEMAYASAPRRTASWASDETMVRDEETRLLSSKLDGLIESSTLSDGDLIYSPRQRRRPWLLFVFACGATLL